VKKSPYVLQQTAQKLAQSITCPNFLNSELAVVKFIYSVYTLNLEYMYVGQASAHMLSYIGKYVCICSNYLSHHTYEFFNQLKPEK
jgi:hypothetical protein